MEPHMNGAGTRGRHLHARGPNLATAMATATAMTMAITMAMAIGIDLSKRRTNIDERKRER